MSNLSVTSFHFATLLWLIKLNHVKDFMKTVVLFLIRTTKDCQRTHTVTTVTKNNTSSTVLVLIIICDKKPSTGDSGLQKIVVT